MVRGYREFSDLFADFERDITSNLEIKIKEFITANFDDEIESFIDKATLIEGNIVKYDVAIGMSTEIKDEFVDVFNNFNYDGKIDFETELSDFGPNDPRSISVDFDISIEGELVDLSIDYNNSEETDIGMYGYYYTLEVEYDFSCQPQLPNI